MYVVSLQHYNVLTCVGQDEVEDTALITDEPIENDSIALYFCSTKITANCEYYYCIGVQCLCTGIVYC